MILIPYPVFLLQEVENMDFLNFDLCINTSRTVIKEIVPALAKLLSETE